MCRLNRIGRDTVSAVVVLLALLGFGSPAFGLPVGTPMSFNVNEDDPPTNVDLTTVFSTGVPPEAYSIVANSNPSLVSASLVGNVLTLANSDLGPERLTGFEIGARSGPVRVTLFDMTVDDAITNVTLSTTPALITRQRQNFGSSRSRGVELDFARTLSNGFSATAGYQFADATLSSGARTPQVPRNQATLQLAYRSFAGVQARWSSMQFDDDVNQFPLRGYFVVDLFGAYPIVSRLDVTLSIENLFDERVETAAMPVITLGQPRAARIGVRWGFR